MNELTGELSQQRAYLKAPGLLGARTLSWTREGNIRTSPSAASIPVDLSALAKEAFLP